MIRRYGRVLTVIVIARIARQRNPSVAQAPSAGPPNHRLSLLSSLCLSLLRIAKEGPRPFSPPPQGTLPSFFLPLFLSLFLSRHSVLHSRCRSLNRLALLPSPSLSLCLCHFPPFQLILKPPLCVTSLSLSPFRPCRYSISPVPSSIFDPDLASAVPAATHSNYTLSTTRLFSA